MKTLLIACALMLAAAFSASAADSDPTLEIPGYAPLRLQALADYLEAHSAYKITEIQGYEPVLGYVEEHFQPQTLSRNITFKAEGNGNHLAVICKLYVYLDPTDQDNFGNVELFDCLTRGWHKLLPDESFGHKIRINELSSN